MKNHNLTDEDIYLICSAFVNLCDDMGQIPYNWEAMYYKAFHFMELYEAALRKKVINGEEE